VPEALSLLALVAPSLVIADIRFPIDRPNAGVRLEGRELVVEGHPDAREIEDRRRAFRRMDRVLRALGLQSLSVLRLPEGSAFHYAGTVPHAPEGSFPLTVDMNGCLRGASRISVADASVLRSMPPLSHTLTAMANAERVGSVLACGL
jgi:hypothetical protein